LCHLCEWTILAENWWTHARRKLTFVGLGGRNPGKRLTTRGVSHMLIRRSEWAETEGPTNPHAFRHGFARAYLTAGGDLATLSKIMGHSDVGVTANFYSIFTVDELQRRHDEFSPLAGAYVS
jgi:integrase/recombinase XerD